MNYPKTAIRQDVLIFIILDDCLLFIHKQIFLNNNSGTYRPPDQLIDQAMEFFHFVSPNLYIQGLSRRISS